MKADQLGHHAENTLRHRWRNTSTLGILRYCSLSYVVLHHHLWVVRILQTAKACFRFNRFRPTWNYAAEFRVWLYTAKYHVGNWIMRSIVKIDLGSVHHVKHLSTEICTSQILKQPSPRYIHPDIHAAYASKPMYCKHGVRPQSMKVVRILCIALSSVSVVWLARRLWSLLEIWSG